MIFPTLLLLIITSITSTTLKKKVVKRTKTTVSTTTHIPPPKDAVMMDWMLDDVGTNTSLIFQGGQAQIIFRCSERIKLCTRPPNKVPIQISQETAANDRTDVKAVWKNGFLEMTITFSEDLPFGEFTCLCNGKNMTYHYLYRLCTMEEVIQNEASFKLSISQSCFAMFDPVTKNVTFGPKLSKKACDKGHLFPVSKKSRNYINHTLCDGHNSFSLCHSIYHDRNLTTLREKRRINIVTTEKSLCTESIYGFPQYSILHVSKIPDNVSMNCKDMVQSSSWKRYVEMVELEATVRITSKRSRFCFLAPKTDKKTIIYIDLIVSNKVRKANVGLWQKVRHTGATRLYEIDIEKTLDRVIQMDTIKVECRRSNDTNSVPFVRSVVRLMFMNISIVPIVSNSQGESCGGFRNLECHLKLSDSSRLRLGYEWTLNGSVTSERSDGSQRAGNDLHLHRGPGTYKCHVRLPLIYPLQFNMKYGAPVVELISAPFNVPYKCLSRQIVEQLHQLQTVNPKASSDFGLHLALALGLIIFCGAFAGVSLLLATKTRVFDKLLGSKSRKSLTDTDVGTFDRGASFISNVKPNKARKKSKS